MDITFAPKDILQIDGARIIYRNFRGDASKFNREGDRNFAVVIPDEEMANQLVAAGWNVKVKEKTDEDPFYYLPVKVKFNGHGPNIYVSTNGHMNRLGEERVGMIDKIDIESVSLDVGPYDWDVNGKQGRTAYLRAMKVVQNIDRFAEDDFPEE